MKRLIIAAAAFGLTAAVYAENMPAKSGSCEERAVSKTGKPLHGAAKTKFMQKCEGGGSANAAKPAADCAAKAVGSNGKPLAGAARASFMKQCEAGGK